MIFAYILTLPLRVIATLVIFTCSPVMVTVDLLMDEGINQSFTNLMNIYLHIWL